jgi:hypothetical protein
VLHSAAVAAPCLTLHSSGLWWVTSWVDGGSLVEGPELLKRGDYYYLFFAAGRCCCTRCCCTALLALPGCLTAAPVRFTPRSHLLVCTPSPPLRAPWAVGRALDRPPGRYCQASYAEGVARSTSIWGPYETMPVKGGAKWEL